MKGIIQFVVAAVAATVITGCVTDRFKTYSGSDIRDVMIDYGPPDSAFDLEGGWRAFQWIVHNSYTTPTHITTHRTLTNPKDYDSWISRRSTIVGGETVSNSCLYTLFATWEEARKTWIVSNERQPRTSCH